MAQSFPDLLKLSEELSDTVSYNTAAYEYKPLSNPEAEIRMAILHPGSYEDEICVSFRGRFLEEEIFPFEALSYAWGSENDPFQVHVLAGTSDEGMIFITRNLEVALRHLRYVSKKRMIWIDALCINQKNIAERNMQVAKMGEIYAHAVRTIVWLGPERDSDEKAFEVLQEIADNIEFDYSIRRMIPSAHSNQPTWADFGVGLPFIQGELNTVAETLQRPYFTRVWIRLELERSQDPVVQCGHRKIAYDDLIMASVCIRQKNRDKHAIDWQLIPILEQTLDAIFDIWLSTRWFVSFDNLRKTLRNAQCKDPRDMIYASLALFQDDDKLGVTPDYSRTIEDLYTDVAFRTLKNRGLHLLTSCEISCRTLSIPSWVPDWSSPTKFHHIIPILWSACGWITSPPITMSGKTIHVTGIEVTRIESITERTSTGSIFSWIVEVIESLRKTESPRHSLADTRNHGPKNIERYCRALLCDYFSENISPPLPELVSLETCRKLVEQLWSSQCNEFDVERLKVEVNEAIINTCGWFIGGRCFFHAAGDYFGYAPKGTQVGDVIAVLLGCNHPMVLRPSVKHGSISVWEVVGEAYAEGLMRGEAIYGNGLPTHYRPLKHRDRKKRPTDDYLVAMYDPETDTLKDDPAEILKEAGISVDSYRREPHRLEVSRETLLAAGIPIKDFVLV